MATPITQSVFKPIDFDLFLDELGFDRQSPAMRQKLINMAVDAYREQLTLGIFSRLTSEDKMKLLDLMEEADKTGNEKLPNDFLTERIPDVQELIEQSIENVKDGLRLVTTGMKETLDEQIAMLLEKKQQQDEAAKLEATKTVPPQPPTPPTSTIKVPVSSEPTEKQKEEITPVTAEPNTTEAFPWEKPAAKSDHFPTFDELLAKTGPATPPLATTQTPPPAPTPPSTTTTDDQSATDTDSIHDELQGLDQNQP